jgi:c-di-GMP-binding flagellar brake protein YcgR
MRIARRLPRPAAPPNPTQSAAEITVSTPMQINFYPMQAIAVQPPWAGEDVWYPSVVLDYDQGKTLSIGAPLSRSQEVLIPPGTRVRLQLALPDGLRRFSAMVVQRNPGPPVAVELTWPEDYQRIQRRENVRVDVTLRVQVCRILENDARGAPLFGITSDISAGGTRIRLAEPLEVLSDIELLFTFPDEVEHRCDARVLRRGELTQAVTELRHWMALEFTNISEVVRREITRLVFDVQREQLRKGVA